MLRHLLWLVTTQQRNQLGRRLSRLKTPRYALAALLGIGYFFFAFGGPSLFRPHGAPLPQRQNPMLYLGPIYITLIFAYAWFGRGVRGALAYTPAEVNLLFPAPFTQRQLMQYKLMRAQVPLVLSALVLMFIARGGGLSAWNRATAGWVLTSTVYLHRIGAELVRANAEQNGAAGWRRARGPALVFLIWLGLIVWAALAALPEVRAAGDSRAALGVLREALKQPPATIALAPFNALLGPFLATTPADWLKRIVLALLVLIAHYFWVMRSNSAFYEASAEASSRMAEIRANVRAGKRVRWRDLRGKREKVRAPWFPLGFSGEPAVAILWKNILYSTRSLSFTLPVMMALMSAPFAVMGYVEHRLSGALLGAGSAMLAVAGIVTFTGPLSFRNDFRMDLTRIELLRSLPLQGVRMALAEVGASTVAMTATQATLVIAGATLVLSSGFQPFARYAALYVIPVLLIVPAFNAIGLGFQNAVALLYPAWVQLGAETPGSVEFMGQQVLNVLVSVFMRIIALILPLLIAGVAGAALRRLGVVGLTSAALLGGAALYGEAYLLIAWLGHRYDQLDLVEAGVLR